MPFSEDEDEFFEPDEDWSQHRGGERTVLKTG